MKPHIKRDRWRRDGYICRSEELKSGGSWLGLPRKISYIGTGATPLAAYLDWYFRRYYTGAFVVSSGPGPLC